VSALSAAFEAFLPAPLLAEQRRRAVAVEDVDGLAIDPALHDAFPSLQTPAALRFICDVTRAVRDDLAAVLERRRTDRAALDAWTADAAARNADRDFRDPSYETVIGRSFTDEAGNERILVGPKARGPAIPPVGVPENLRGPQVTLFGPPDTAKLAINAMNAWHRIPADEPSVLTALVERSGAVPRWGADDEDSKTPIMRDFLYAADNLVRCFDGSLTFTEPRSGKHYALADDKLARPIKRVPGLALPDGTHLLDGDPIPLHVFDFALHAFHNRTRPEALTYYIPKLENEDEARYVRTLVEAVETRLRDQHPAYEAGTIRLLIVFENPRAIFRIAEIATALGPHFLGGSLGWHDFLASTARLFKNDPQYRIPVKADPDIVIDHIRESHRILAETLGPSGAMRIGGMYGVLPLSGHAGSLTAAQIGFVRDVITQLRRDLDGFWVAHPDFVRLGIALVQAWEESKDAIAAGALESTVLAELLEALLPDPSDREPLFAFLARPDATGLDRDDPLYARAVLAADVNVSNVIANDHPDEVRYNAFQALQYLTDWLGGNGCVALPATLPTPAGPVPVRIMDDLATTERSRWELWAEVHHGRVSEATFDAILEEELAAIRAGDRTVAVAWTSETEGWYRMAARILRGLVTTDDPPEFVTEWILPFTLPVVREADDPWAFVTSLCPDHLPV
jgi:malate synthase